MRYFTFFLLIMLVLGACEKKVIGKHLDTSQKTIDVIEDDQALLDNMNVMSPVPSMGEISGDNIYVLDSTFNSINRNEFNAFIWAQDVYEGRGNVDDWGIPFQQISYANTVLSTVDKLPDHEPAGDLLKGSALFMRAFAYYQLSQLFIQPFDSLHSSEQLGLPLPLTPGIGTPSVRSSMKATYDRIIVDLNQACRLLPAKADPNRKNRPSQPAAYALLARLYLTMGDYGKAKLYADSCLMDHSLLLDFNNALLAMPRPFLPNQDEVIYQACLLPSTEILKSGNCIIDSNLYNSYDANDLRKVLFFKMNPLGLPVTNYTFSGTVELFAGIATDEVYLIRAECLARLGGAGAALDDLNTLLIKRMRKGTFSAFTDTTGDVLKLILTERRKELVNRAMRWSDIRRFNAQKDAITLIRKYNGKVYVLEPGNTKWVLPIPPDVIRLSGMQQNPR